MCIFLWIFCMPHRHNALEGWSANSDTSMQAQRSFANCLNPASILTVAITDVVGRMLWEKKDAGRDRAWTEGLANCPQPEKGY